MVASAPDVTIRQVERPDPALLPALVELLRDSVHGGASVGFLAPVAPQVARDHWLGVFSQLGGHQRLWIAEDATGVVGSVQIDL